MPAARSRSHWHARYAAVLLGCLTACGNDEPQPQPALDAGNDAAVLLPAIDEVAASPDLQPQYRGEPSHLGLAPEGATLTPPLALRWTSERFGIGSYTASKSSPAIDHERLYVGMDDGVLYALERSDGAVAWRFATDRAAVEAAAPGPDHYGIHASPAFDEEQVYVADYDGVLYALDRQAGTLEWKRDLGGSIGASPVLHEGVVYVAVEFPSPPDGKLYGLHTRSGEIVVESGWLGEHAHASLTIDSELGLGFVGDNAGTLHAIDLRDGRERWRHQADAPIKSTAALQDGWLYVTSWDRHLYALDALDGREQFRFAVGGPSMSSPSLFGGLVLFGAYDRNLHAVDARSGELRWRFATQGDVQSSPTVVRASELVLLASRDGRLYVLDAQDGELRQALDVGEELTSVPVVVDGQVYVADDAGRVHRFDDAM